MIRILTCIASLLFVEGTTHKEMVDTSVYMDVTRPIQERVEALLNQMTLEEKIGQMEMMIVGNEKTIVKNKWYDFGAWIADLEPEECNRLQAYSEQTRLKIPYLIGADAAHGHARLKGRTVFPTSISMAATFNRELVRLAAAKSAEEIRSTGVNWTFAPCVDIVQDARWGRTGETYGEDPFLSCELVREAISGLQGNLDAKKNVATSVKHLAGGGVSVGGVNHASAELSERALRSYILPPFKAAIEAGALTIMPGHNDIAGVPAHASKWLLTDLIKKEYGFKGFYISDMLDVENLKSNLHGIAANQEEAILMSVNAGLDMHMYSKDTTTFVAPLMKLVREKKVSEERINDAVRRILTVKFRLGLFENRYVDPKNDRFGTEENRQVALDAARECIVLLKNEKSLLPLDVKKYKRILVTGPNADNQALLGDWSTCQPEGNVVTVLEGIKRIAEKSDIQIVYSMSGRLKSKKSTVTVNTTDPDTQRQQLEEGGGISDYSIADAVSKAKQCDLAVVAIGGYGLRTEWGMRTYGESADRPSIDFYGRQVELVKKISETGIPVVVVINNGKPLNNPWITEHVPAIVDIWEPGMYGGQALAEVLFGEVNPSGKLPITVPKHAGQIPMFYYQKYSRYLTGYGLGSSHEDEKPAFCFGHGLSYTSFEYSDLQITDEIKAGEDIKVTFKVKNTGTRAGKETALLFVRDKISSVVTPLGMLKGFEKVELQPGEQKDVTLSVPYQELALWNTNMEHVVESGEFIMSVGRSWEDLREKKIVRLR